MTDHHQYYPTPEALSIKAWETFKNRQFVRLLEPSAGEGHLFTYGGFSPHGSVAAVVKTTDFQSSSLSVGGLVRRYSTHQLLAGGR